MPPRPSLAEIFFIALRLGCTSFGGPVAHLAFFRKEYVDRLRWLDEAHYADLVALCQFLPGPASSQTGFGVGYLQRGLAGGLAAWLGFTLPSACLMIGLAYGVGTLSATIGSGWLQGLKVASVAVVAQAVWAMAKTLCPDWPRRGLALMAALLMTWIPLAWIQIAVLFSAALIGWLFFKKKQLAPLGITAAPSIGRHVAIIFLGIYFMLLVLLPVLSRSTRTSALTAFDRFYRSGALVFGGGHAVLPLLDQEVVAPGWLSHDQFLAGYGAAQAMPGPLFTLSAYLGTVMKLPPVNAAESISGHKIFPPQSHPWLGGVWALVAIFLPGLLLLAGTLPYWQKLRHQAGAQAALRGTNAAVVGILVAALYHPVWTSSITNGVSVLLAVIAFATLQFGKIPAWAVVLGLAALGHWVF